MIIDNFGRFGSQIRAPYRHVNYLEVAVGVRSLHLPGFALDLKRLGKSRAAMFVGWSALSGVCRRPRWLRVEPVRPPLKLLPDHFLSNVAGP